MFEKGALFPFLLSPGVTHFRGLDFPLRSFSVFSIYEILFSSLYYRYTQDFQLPFLNDNSRTNACQPSSSVHICYINMFYLSTLLNYYITFYYTKYRQSNHLFTKPYPQPALSDTIAPVCVMTFLQRLRDLCIGDCLTGS
jgi:hypothetical protein